jgi:hypothetical protein
MLDLYIVTGTGTKTSGDGTMMTREKQIIYRRAA